MQYDGDDYSSSDSDSSISFGSLSDRSDMPVEELERIVLRYEHRRRLKWGNLSVWEKLKLFKAWYIVSLLGDLFLIFGCMFTIFANEFMLGYAEIFLGLGTMCIWSSITKYLANTEEFYVILRTFKAAIPSIVKVWIGVLPFYIGVCFLSMTVAWEFKDSFGDFTSGFYTMFSVQAGDALFDTFASLKEANFWYAQIFMYLFIFFVISVVQNIFMAIVEDAYISIKYAKNFDWLNNNRGNGFGGGHHGGGGNGGNGGGGNGGDNGGGNGGNGIDLANQNFLAHHYNYFPPNV